MFSWGVCSGVTGLAILVCHRSSQLSLEMTKEQILTSAALTCLSRSLWSAAVLPPSPAQSIPFSLLGSSAPGVSSAGSGCQAEDPFLFPEAQAAGFTAEWWFYLEPEEVKSSDLATGDNSQASADATSLCALGLQGPFRTALCAMPLPAVGKPAGLMPVRVCCHLSPG